MKIFQPIFLLIACIVLAISCQKEVSIENGGVPSAGTLKVDVSGDCLPSSVHGIYKADSTLNATSYIDVQINVTTPGTYNIKSDSVNGFSFKGFGAVSTPGLNTIRLNASGKPLVAGTNTFTIKYNGTICLVDVTVISSTSSVAIYSMTGAPNTCSGAIVNGSYTAGTPLDASNTVRMNVNVITSGAYTIAATPNNGMFFTTSGVFTTTGAQTITLIGNGTPAAAGAFNISAGSANSTCTFSITVAPAGGGTPASYTLGGAPGSCTGVVLNGTYAAGAVMTSANTATVNVNVTTSGTYTVSTTAVNGVTFSGIGTFATTGAQTVVLTATGTPTASGPFNFPITGGGNTCTFPITFVAGANQAVYTLSGAPGACTIATISGTYSSGTVLTAANTVTVQVNVTTIGSYNLSTNTVNGMTFAKSGTFTVLGIQPVVLAGTGTPLNTGIHTFTPVVGTSSCTFSVTVTGTPPPTNLDYIPETTFSNWSYALVGGTAADTFYTRVSPNTFGIYKIFENLDNGTPYDTALHRKSGGLYYQLYNQSYGFDNNFNVEVLLLDSNLATNATWTINLGANTIGGVPVTGKIVAQILQKGATTTIAGNNYTNIIKVKYIFSYNIGLGDTGFADVEIWYAKGKGAIRQAIDDIPSTGAAIYEATRIQIF